MTDNKTPHWQQQGNSVVNNADGRRVADCFVVGGVAYDEAGKNARLIAAAPDLLKALESVRDELLEEIDGADESRGRDTRLSLMLDTINRALSKAKGAA